jgi:hypothetical protein
VHNSLAIQSNDQEISIPPTPSKNLRLKTYITVRASKQSILTGGRGSNSSSRITSDFFFSILSTLDGSTCTEK